MYAVIRDLRTERLSVLWKQDIVIDMTHPKCPFEIVAEVTTYRDALPYIQPQESKQ